MVKSKRDRTLEIVTHFIGIFSGAIGPLVILVLTSDKDVRRHSKNALNWQISLLFYIGIFFILSLIISLVKFIFDGSSKPFNISLFLWFFGFLNVFFCLIASFKASERVFWVYPFSIDFVGKIDKKKIEDSRRRLIKNLCDLRRALKI